MKTRTCETPQTISAKDEQWRANFTSCGIEIVLLVWIEQNRKRLYVAALITDPNYARDMPRTMRKQYYRNTIVHYRQSIDKVDLDGRYKREEYKYCCTFFPWYRHIVKINS